MLETLRVSLKNNKLKKDKEDTFSVDFWMLCVFVQNMAI